MMFSITVQFTAADREDADWLDEKINALVCNAEPVIQNSTHWVHEYDDQGGLIK